MVNTEGASGSGDGEGPGGIAGDSYIRYIPPNYDDGEGPEEYIGDSEDEEWLESDESPEGISMDLLEHVMDRLEKQHHCLLSRRPELRRNFAGRLNL